MWCGILYFISIISQSLSSSFYYYYKWLLNNKCCICLSILLITFLFLCVSSTDAIFCARYCIVYQTRVFCFFWYVMNTYLVYIFICIKVVALYSWFVLFYTFFLFLYPHHHTKKKNVYILYYFCICKSFSPSHHPF